MTERPAFARSAASLLDGRLRAFGPDVAVSVATGLWRYHRGERLFALLRPLATRVDVGFTKLGRARSQRILDARAARLPFVRHRVVVEAPGDVDRELLAWLREAYETASDEALTI